MVRSPFQKTLVRNANAHHGFNWDTTGFPAGTTFDVGIDWYYWWQSGTEYGCQVQQVNDSTYILGFEDMGIPPWYVDLIVQVVVHGGGPKLVVLQPTANSQNQHITHEPLMPTVTCEAQLQNYNGGQVTYDWEYKVDYQLETRSGSYPYKGTTTASGSGVTTWSVPFENIFRGGKVTLTVNATTAEGKTYAATVSPNSVIGDNPSASEARSGVDLKLQVLMYKETRFRQFDGRGYPFYGPGKKGGYGICQPDNPVANEQELWNWKDNRDRGSQILAGKAALAAGYAGRVRNGKTWYKDPSNKWRANDAVPFRWYGEVSPTGKYIRQIPYPNARDLQQGEELLKETFQRYNGGHYWRWMPDIIGNSTSSGNWKSQPTNNYGDDWWNTYQDVMNGHPPSDWN